MISYSDIDIAHKKKSVVKIGRNKVIPRGVVMTIQLRSNSPIKMHHLSFLDQSERKFLIIHHMLKLSLIFTSDDYQENLL
jgi:hypothetical protein